MTRTMRGDERYRQKVYQNQASIRKGDFVALGKNLYDEEIYEVTSDAYVIDGIWYVNLYNYGRCELAKLEKVTA